MRLRSIAALSASALAVLALAGCGSVSDDGDATPSATATPSASAAPVEMCDAGEESGKAADCVDVSGDFGSEATAEFEAPLGIPDISSAVISEGDGDKIAAGDYVTYAATMYDAETGEKLGAEGYEPFSSLPLGIVEGSYLDAFVDVPLGSRVAFTIPQQTAATGQSVQAAVAVIDVFEKAPTAAWGEDVAPEDGFPTVTLAEDGTPDVTVPEDLKVGDTTAIEVLKQGDGETVADGDQVFVQYKGVKVADGEEFDSSWGRGAPTSFPTNGVIEGFTKALVGQKVGSQVVAVIPKAEAYAGSESELAEDDLIFVVDILGTAHVPAA
ncbi:peptidylprolyl isomerase [Microbacterium nanhaiense]|uniref:peptidylprolyl isomerase n=1 Tax=Microbacterium nanhaiense TaxID=1301026 RepID=A0ABQ2MZW7_9MICO|nr:FKBP-type peptidyl-prolyl cis-trans isomerase [Microbacterium nanhaiense]GGO62678.1 peptidylprolyl isomerase [Microbacterium nanhaiense]